MIHRIEITILPGLDVDWFSDMARINFPMLDSLVDDMRIIVPSSTLFVMEFLFDGNLATWIHFLTTNGVNFAYKFIAGA